MKRLIAVMAAVLLALPVVALAGPGFRHGFKKMDPVMVKKALKDAGCSDQQIRRIEALRDEAERQGLDIRSELDKARLEMKQLMQADSPDRAAIFKQIDKIGAIQLRLKKNRVGLILDIRKEVTPEQWEKMQLLRAEHRMQRHKWKHKGPMAPQQ